MIAKDLICGSVEDFMSAKVVSFVNPYSLRQIMKAEVPLDRFDALCIDGVALKVFFNLVYRDLNIERLSFDFTSIAGAVFDRAASDGERGFILGSDATSNHRFLDDIRAMFPGIELDGRSGYFDGQTERGDCLASIVDGAYDFVVIGMGAVKQEQAVNDLLDSGFQGRIYTCGGFIHQTAMSGGTYYPAWVDRLNVRFAYRMLKEPTTVRRYLVEYPKAFAFLLANLHRFRAEGNKVARGAPTAETKGKLVDITTAISASQPADERTAHRAECESTSTDALARREEQKIAAFGLANNHRAAS